MTIQTILRLGDPRLFEVSKNVTEFNTPELDNLIEDMFDTMIAADGAGLAAPQIGIALRVAIFGFENNPRYPDSKPVPKTILINPTVMPLSEIQEDDWEGCLSVPGMRGMVSRYKNIRYTGFNASGSPINVEASGFHARVVQHECDHLDGIIYTQRLSNPQKFGFTEQLLASGQLCSDACSE